MHFRPFSSAQGATLMVALILSLGCRRADVATGSTAEPAGDDHPPHEHESQSARITVWTERHEVFAEHPAPVAGKPVTFVTHVTRRSDWKARTEGPVTFRLRQGEKST